MPFEFSLEGGLFYDGPTDLPGERYYQYCTAIPVGTMLAQTWNRDLVQKVGTMIGKEMEQFGVTLWLAPGMNTIGILFAEETSNIIQKILISQELLQRL